MNNILDNNVFMLSFSLKDLYYCPPSAGLKRNHNRYTISAKIKSTLFLQFDFMSTNGLQRPISSTTAPFRSAKTIRTLQRKTVGAETRLRGSEVSGDPR